MLPTQSKNPKGLHQRYYVAKIIDWQYIGDNFLGSPMYKPVLEDVDDEAEYFVMRVDEGGSDLKHIAACRIGVHAYANAIEAHLPDLAKDLRERYPLLHSNQEAQ
jgi:hypothetical protein